MSRILYKYIDIDGGRCMIGMEKGCKYPTLQFANPTQMNDPFDCHQNLLDYSNIPDSMTQGWIPKEWLKDKEENDALNMRNWAWISCLSKVNDSSVMWSHYSKNHSGICIGLNLDVIMANIPPLFDAIYCEPLVLEVQYQDTSHHPDFNTVPWTYQFETKDKQWSYEQEVRLVFPRASRMYADYSKPTKSNDIKELRIYLPLKGESFEEIFFGKDIAPKAKAKIINYARTNLNPDIKLYQMNIDEHAFRLKAELITD